jgi:hypothetical protein
VTLRNPWVDPRVQQLRPEGVRAYLLAHGWEYLGPGEVPDTLMFDTPQPRGDKPNVLLPLKLEHPPQVQRMVELVGDVALHEGRWAVDVLDDMLRQPDQATPVNGPVAPTRAEPAPQG